MLSGCLEWGEVVWNGGDCSGFVRVVLGPSECQEAQGSFGQVEAIGREVGSGSRSGEVAKA